MKKHILITGAGKGIGRAIALEFAARNGKNFKPELFLVSRTASDLAAIRKICEKAGVPCEVLAGDLASSKTIDKVYAEATKKFGKVDCLINNAGVGTFADIEDLTEKDYDHVMNTNLKSVFLITRKVFETMRKKKSGHLYFITSTAAEKPYDGGALYCMSKFGQKGFVEVMRLAARKCNVRVTNVMPGPVETPMWGELGPKMRHRMMQPEDIAKAVVDSYLLPERTVVEEIVLRPVGGDLQDSPSE